MKSTTESSSSVQSDGAKLLSNQPGPIAVFRDTIKFASDRIFSFSFEQNDSGIWFAWILDQPAYGDRPSDPQATYRLMENGRYLVNWGSPQTEYAEIKKIAAIWAARTDRYIAYGIKMDV